MRDNVSMAIEFAVTAHKGQTRRYTKEPYIVHPFAVAGLVSSVSGNQDMLIAAFLHDVVEDCGASLAHIEYIFGPNAASLVCDLTDISTPEYGNREARKRLDREHTAKGSADAHTIKLADLIDNSRSILQYDPRFSKIYMNEMRLLLDVLRDGDPYLFGLADSIVKNFYPDHVTCLGCDWVGLESELAQDGVFYSEDSAYVSHEATCCPKCKSLAWEGV